MAKHNRSPKKVIPYHKMCFSICFHDVRGFAPVFACLHSILKTILAQKELKKHNPELIKRPSLLLLTKTDLIPAQLLKIGKISKVIPIIKISSVTGKNLNVAIQLIAQLIQSTTHDSKVPAD